MSKHKSICAILIIIISILCCSCVGKEQEIEVTDKDYMNDFPYMNVIEHRSGAGHNVYLVYDKETMVEYFIDATSYKGGICPRYDSSGNVMIYKGDE